MYSPETIINTIDDIAFELVHGEDSARVTWDAEALLTGAGILPTEAHREELDRAIAEYLAGMHGGWVTLR